MKNLYLLFAFLLWVSCNTVIDHKKLIGEWFISDLEYPEKLGQGQQESVKQVLQELKKRTWRFGDNGKLEIQNGDQIKQMKWEISDGNQMKIKSEEGEEVYTVLETGDKTFKMEKRREKSVVVLKFNKK